MNRQFETTKTQLLALLSSLNISISADTKLPGELYGLALTLKIGACDWVDVAL